MSQGVPVRTAERPRRDAGRTFHTDGETHRWVSARARAWGVSYNEALNRIVREQRLAEGAQEAARRSYQLTPRQERVVDAVLASIGAHAAGEDGT